MCFYVANFMNFVLKSDSDHYYLNERKINDMQYF